MASTTPNKSGDVEEIVAKAKAASYGLGASSIKTRNEVLEKMAESLMNAKEEILAANAEDCKNYREMIERTEKENNSDVSAYQALLKRLTFTEGKLEDALRGIKELIEMPDPLNKCTMANTITEGLTMHRITTPIGLLCVIYEARPEAGIQIASLAIKSGNALILKGGKDAIATNAVICKAIKAALDSVTGVESSSVAHLDTRESISELLKLDHLVDLVIPRGSNALVRRIMKESSIPVMGHAEGVCNAYVDQHADFEMALDLIEDSKIDYCAACNAIETILVHEQICADFLPKLRQRLNRYNVVFHGCQESCKYLRKAEDDKSVMQLPSDDRLVWRKEWLSHDVNVRVVKNVEEAVSHINTFSSHHTDCIITRDEATAQTFLRSVDSAGVYHNCSTRFADGQRYGFGAEVGIATGKIHARGPVGMEGLTSYKYILRGSGQTVANNALFRDPECALKNKKPVYNYTELPRESPLH